MSNSDDQILPGSETDLALDRALEAANLRAGGATETAAHVAHPEEPSAVDVGDLGGAGADGD
ncbi:hypothetical protein NQ166_00305 [Microbacterium sp. zg.Y1090]|uniref:hypothetical protein n=1 Tax=Microbacterium TaxID=33882 RepID=UPI00214C5E11|nr:MULTISPECIES: hypothetical protein [unclassified Microbacterium]MCR2812921.1 hypothetical protein [Microbacterium sp. zg.Y1084]MCR2817270.1 hypothetical protein [Microbacterium sp. zg.Y1090]MDL5486064.1 hypothetical protein [Microbacterium sp. zg-Y1211]WIM29241.1 hypothetical protein QNO26_04905 [Microbacterium sp. zg-Y1090]